MMLGGRTGTKPRRAVAATGASEPVTLTVVTTVKTQLKLAIAGTSIVGMSHGNITRLRAATRQRPSSPAGCPALSAAFAAESRRS
jgi:hypothetical protein